MIAAALLWSTSGLFAKAPTFDDWPRETRGLQLAFWRALFAAVVLLPGVRRPRFRPALVPMTAAFAAMSATYMSAMSLSTAANAIWLQSTAPVWVCLFGWALWGEPPGRPDLAALAFAAVGVGLILWFELATDARWGILLGLASGACYGMIVLSLRSLRGENSAWLVVVNNSASALCLAPWVLGGDHWPLGSQWPVLVAFGVLQIGLPYLLFTWGLKSISSHEGAGLSLLEPILLPAWVYLAWGSEFPAWWTLAGGGLILTGLAVRYLVSR